MCWNFPWRERPLFASPTVSVAVIRHENERRVLCSRPYDTSHVQARWPPPPPPPCSISWGLEGMGTSPVRTNSACTHLPYLAPTRPYASLSWANHDPDKKVVINALEHIPDMRLLLLGRVLGGISTSLLFSAFESWMVSEHRKQGTVRGGKRTRGRQHARTRGRTPQAG